MHPTFVIPSAIQVNHKLGLTLDSKLVSLEREEPPVRPEKPAREDVENREQVIRWLRSTEVARMFGVDRRTVLNWARKGLLDSQLTAGGHRRYREADALSLLAELKAVA